jgi:CHAT domain-containing protein
LQLSTLTAVCISLSGCFADPPPQKAYEQIVSEVNKGDLGTARRDADHAITRYGSKSQEWSWRFRILKAQILITQSAPQEALALLNGPLPPELATKDDAVRKVLLEGTAYRSAQEFAPAASKLNEAQHLAESFQPQLLCEVLNAVGALEIAENRYDNADEALHRALALARQQHNARQEASVLLNLALVATNRERYDEAIDRNQEALQLSRSLGMQSLVATILGNLGWAYSELGDFEASLGYYKQGAEASAKSGLPGYSAYWFSAVADTYIALHEYSPAEELARGALENARRLKNGQTTTQCLNTLAEVMLRTRRLAEAERYNQEALRIEAAGLDNFGTLRTLILAGHIAANEKRFKDGDEIFQRVLGEPGAGTPLRWEAAAGLARIRDGQGNSVDAERLYLQAIKIIEQARDSIHHDELRLSFLSSGIAVYGQYIDFLVRQARPADALRQAELSRARTLGEGLASDTKANSRSISTPPPQQLARKLHATLLVYWLDEDHSFLWVITPTKTTSFGLPPASEIDHQLKAYGKAIVNSKDVLTSEDRLTGEKLYAMLIAPAQKLIPANSRIILLPDQSLYGLNFETLIAPEPKPHYWIEDVTLTTASSLTLLAAAANRPPPKEKNLLLVGNTKQANIEFPPLSQSALEMKKVEQYFPESHRLVLEEAKATPSAYLSSNPERFSYLHFATHGTASSARPLESAVVLSPEGESFKLYARDVVTKHLRAELVTISACYGSGKRAYSGEGLVGLSWAFLRAGAHNVIGALWEVADAPATPELMDSLYNELNRGKDPATALRDAKLKLLHSGTVFAKPFYWAPFQLYAGS